MWGRSIRRVPAPIRLGFTRIKAVSPPCGRWTADIVPDTRKGDDGAEFGCATQANLAAMVENPNDLLMPRAQTPVHGWQRWQATQKLAHRRHKRGHAAGIGMQRPRRDEIRHRDTDRLVDIVHSGREPLLCRHALEACGVKPIGF